MSDTDKLTDRDWLISLLTIEQEQMLTDYEVHPDVWKGDPERTDCTAALADGILEGLAHRRASQAAPAPVAWRWRDNVHQAWNHINWEPKYMDYVFVEPLYTAPAPVDALREENERLRAALAAAAVWSVEGSVTIKEIGDVMRPFYRPALSTPTEERQ